MRLRLLAALLTLAASALCAVDLNKPIAELSLADGRTLKNVTFVSYASSAIMAKWDGGRGTISYDLLPEGIASAAEKMRPRPSSYVASKPQSAPATTQQTATAQSSTPSQPKAQASTTRKISGEVFIGGGESQAIRVKFAGLRITAYNLEEAASAFNTRVTPTMPTPLGEVDADGEGRFELELPAGVPVMLVAKGKHRAAKGGRVTDWEWRVPESEIKSGRVMLHDGNAYSLPTSTINRR